MNKDYYTDLMAPAFAGMKADMGFDRVESYPAAVQIAFGTVAAVDGEGRLNLAGNGTAVGIALHSHAVAGGAYMPKDTVSVMTRGLVWARAVEQDASQTGGAVKFDANGFIDSRAGGVLTNARVREKHGNLVLVELHSPQV